MKLVCFAVQEEATTFRKAAIAHGGVATLVTGMGRRNAETAVRRFLAGQSAGLVLTCGFAGGLNPDLAPGAVVYETTDAALAARLAQAGAKPARIFWADRVAVTVAEKQALRHTTGADAVEMESGAIQALCSELKIPCATVRVISDAAGEDLPLDFNRLYRPDMTLDFGKLGWMLAKSPWKIGGLIRLQKRCQFAAERLAEVLVKVAPAAGKD
jgi:adenosylhomocysteine nucleosidase